MTLLGALNATLRYLSGYLEKNLISNLYTEAQWYLFAAVFLLAAPYVLQQNKHVRVDVFYSRQSSVGQAWIDLLGTILFLIPFCIFGVWSSWDFVLQSWESQEVSSDAGGLERFPVKALIPISFILLFLQAICTFYRKAEVIQGKGS
jgi:TRAP-type mannitol/chloroaromatic compound transport system permease small subunit